MNEISEDNILELSPSFKKQKDIDYQNSSTNTEENHLQHSIELNKDHHADNSNDMNMNNNENINYEYFFYEMEKYVYNIQLIVREKDLDLQKVINQIQYKNLQNNFEKQDIDKQVQFCFV